MQKFGVCFLLLHLHSEVVCCAGLSGSSVLTLLCVCVASLNRPVDGASSRVLALAVAPHPPWLRHGSYQPHRSLVGNRGGSLS